jgi:signal transduction histidine kinase
MMRTFFQRRLQLQLLLILLAGVAVAALSVLLIWDSVHNAERVVIGDMGGQLNSALTELARQYAYRADSDSAWASLPLASQDVSLRGVTQAVLRSYPGVEGGFFANGEFVGYAFPTHDNPAAKTDVPAAERSIIEDVSRRAKASGDAQELLRGGSELVLVRAMKTREQDAVTWAMQRRPRQTGTGWRRVLLVALVLAALMSVGGTLRMAVALRRGVTEIQNGLAGLEKDFNRSLPESSGELGEITKSVNRMAEVRRKLEEELRREDRLRTVGRTVAGFAHEIRNPLNGIRLSMQVLEQRLKSGVVEPSDLKLVMGEVDRMDALLTDLLAFREKKSTDLSEQDVLPVVERCVELVQTPNGGSRIRIEMLGERSPLAASVDTQKLMQATLNLLLNAVEASGENGEVVASLRRNHENVEIEIRDSGPELTAEQQQHMFEAFYTTKLNGTGLGLAVSRQLILEMGGDLRYEAGTGKKAFVISLRVVARA